MSAVVCALSLFGSPVAISRCERERGEWSGLGAAAGEVAAGRETPVTGEVFADQLGGSAGRASVFLAGPVQECGVGPEEKKMSFPFSKMLNSVVFGKFHRKLNRADKIMENFVCASHDVLYLRKI